MKLRFLLVLLLGFVFSFQVNAAPNPKPGGACKKLGQSQTIQGKKFTCIKSGKKLVWNKGVESSKPTPVSNSNPSAESLDPTRGAAKSVDAQFKAARKTELRIEFLKSNDANALFAEFGEEVIEKSAQFWGNFYKPTKTIPVVIASPKTMDWLNTQLGKYSYTLPQWRYDQIKSMGDDGMQLDVDVNPSTDSVIYFVVGSNTPWLTPNMVKTMITHEFVHTVQVGILKTRNGLIPCWSNEGSAIFYGNAITAAGSGDVEIQYLKYRNEWLNQLNFKNTLMGKSKEDLLALLKSSETDFRVCAAPLRLGYSAGSLMTELLVAKNGHEKFVKWWILSTEKDWKVAFKEVFGQDVDRFYSDVAIPYLLESAQK